MYTQSASNDLVSAEFNNLVVVKNKFLKTVYVKIVLCGVTESKPGLARFQDFWAHVFL